MDNSGVVEWVGGWPVVIINILIFLAICSLKDLFISHNTDSLKMYLSLQKSTNIKLTDKIKQSSFERIQIANNGILY